MRGQKSQLPPRCNVPEIGTGTILCQKVIISGGLQHRKTTKKLKIRFDKGKTLWKDSTRVELLAAPPPTGRHIPQPAPTIPFFCADCSNCVCGIPHTFQEHQTAVQQALEELEYERTLLEDDLRHEDSLLFDGDECSDITFFIFDPLPDLNKIDVATLPHTIEEH